MSRSFILIHRITKSALSACLAVVSSATVAQASPALDETRNIVKEWVLTEKAISSEAAAWNEKEELFEDLLKTAQIEIDTLQASIQEIEANSTGADKRRAELVSELEELKSSRVQIASFLNKVEPRLLRLQSSLPRPLLEANKALFQRLSSKGDNSSQSIAERMQTVVAVLSAIQTFDQLVSVHEELKELSDGTVREVEVVYVGLGAAYYRTRNGSDAGYGRPTNDGWKWVSKPALATSVRDAIDIAKNTTQEARFISLPVKLLR